MRFEWNDTKNVANQDKHGVSFEEASELFTSGEDYLEIFDQGHSEVEERFIAIGAIGGHHPRLVLVVFTERDGDIIRIISARWANKREAKMYIEHREHRT